METVLSYKQSLFLMLRSKLLSAFLYFVDLADICRSSIIRKTMKVSVFRTLFIHRPYRLAVFFVLSLITNFFISIFFPLYGLLLGPIIFGIPHMFASLRYLPKMAVSKQTPQAMINYVGFIFIIAATIRIAFNEYHFALKFLPNGPELFMVCISLLSIAFLTKQKFTNLIFTFLLVSMLSICSYAYPYQTIGALVLIHNFLSFVFWLKASTSTKDTTVAVVSLLVFSLVTFLILFGTFDALMIYRPTGILNNALNDLSIGSMISPGSSFEFWSRAVSAYAFGQGMHYFVWLKAIPEQELKDGPTISFNKSFKMLEADIGKRTIFACILLMLFILAICLFKSFPAARYIYLVIASFHGYFEFTCLFLEKEQVAV